jgi:hypothetical protein
LAQACRALLSFYLSALPANVDRQWVEGLQADAGGDYGRAAAACHGWQARGRHLHLALCSGLTAPAEHAKDSIVALARCPAVVSLLWQFLVFSRERLSEEARAAVMSVRLHCRGLCEELAGDCRVFYRDAGEGRLHDLLNAQVGMGTSSLLLWRALCVCTTSYIVDDVKKSQSMKHQMFLFKIYHFQSKYINHTLFSIKVYEHVQMLNQIQ